MMEWYICLSCTRQWLFIRFHLFQSHSILAHPPAPVYSLVFTPGLCRSDMGVSDLTDTLSTTSLTQAFHQYHPSTDPSTPKKADEDSSTLYQSALPTSKTPACISLPPTSLKLHPSERLPMYLPQSLRTQTSLQATSAQLPWDYQSHRVSPVASLC